MKSSGEGKSNILAVRACLGAWLNGQPPEVFTAGTIVMVGLQDCADRRNIHPASLAGIAAQVENLRRAVEKSRALFWSGLSV